MIFPFYFLIKVYNLSQNVQEDDLQHLQVTTFILFFKISGNILSMYSRTSGFGWVFFCLENFNSESFMNVTKRM